MLLSFGGLSLSLSVPRCGKPPSPGGFHYPPVAPGGGSSFVRFRTAAHAAKPPPAPPRGGSCKKVSRRVFGCLLCVFVPCVSLRFLSAFSPLLSLLGCRSFCHGSSRYALYFLRNELSDFLPCPHTAATYRRKHVRQYAVWITQRIIRFIFPVIDFCRNELSKKAFSLTGKKGALQTLHWYLIKTTIYLLGKIVEMTIYSSCCLCILHHWGVKKDHSPLMIAPPCGRPFSHFLHATWSPAERRNARQSFILGHTFARFSILTIFAQKKDCRTKSLCRTLFFMI